MDVVGAQDVGGEGAQSGEDGGLAADAAVIFAEAAIADVVQPIFDAPMVTDRPRTNGCGQNVLGDEVRSLMCAEIVARVGEITRAREEFKQRELQIAVERSAVSKTWVLERLKENVERSMQAIPVLDNEGNPTGEYQYNGFVANKALELLGREIGMFVERHEVTLAQRLTEMPEDQRAAEMFDLVARARERLQQLRAVEQRTIEGSATEVSGSDVQEGEPPEE